MDYSRAELDSMRMDAMRRTREMRSKAENREPQSSGKESKEKENAKLPGTAEAKEKERSGTGHSGGLLPGVQIDNDKLIIIMLIVILAREKADFKLLLALLYIML